MFNDERMNCDDKSKRLGLKNCWSIDYKETTTAGYPGSNYVILVTNVFSNHD